MLYISFHDDFGRANTEFGADIGAPTDYFTPDSGSAWEGHTELHRILDGALHQLPNYGHPFDSTISSIRRPYSASLVDSKIRAVISFDGEPATDSQYNDLTREFFLEARANEDSAYVLALQTNGLQIRWRNAGSFGPDLVTGASISPALKLDGTKYVVALTVLGIGNDVVLSGYVKSQATGEVLAQVSGSGAEAQNLTLKNRGTFALAHNRGYKGRQIIHSVTGYDLSNGAVPTDDDVIGDGEVVEPRYTFAPSVTDGLVAIYNADTLAGVSDGQIVSVVSDQASQPAHGTTQNGGTFDANLMNGRGGIALNDAIALGNPAKLNFSNHNYTLFLVVRPRNLHFYTNVLSKLVSNGPNSRLFLISALGLQNYESLRRYSSISPFYANYVNVVTYSFDATTSEQVLRVNGAEVARSITPYIDAWSNEGNWKIADAQTGFGSFFPYNRLLSSHEVETVEGELLDHYHVAANIPQVAIFIDGNSLSPGYVSKVFENDWETSLGLPAWTHVGVSGKNQYQVRDSAAKLDTAYIPGCLNVYSSFEGQNSGMSEETYQAALETYQNAKDAGYYVIAWTFFDCPRSYDVKEEAFRLVSNQRLRDMAGQPDCPFDYLIDDTRLVDYGTFNPSTATPLISIDGIHTNDTGTALISSVFRENLNAALLSPGFHSSITGLLSLEAKYHAYTDTNATTSATADGTKVAAFKGRGIALLQTEEGRRPVLRLGAGINGADAFAFDGQNDTLIDSSLAVGSNYTVIVIAKLRRRCKPLSAFFGVKGVSNFYFDDTDLLHYNTDFSIGLNSHVAASNFHSLYGLSISDTQVDFYLDGRHESVAKEYVESAGAGVSLGAIGDSFPLDASISHILIHPTAALSPEQMATLRSELGAYYNGIPDRVGEAKTLVVSEGNSYLSAGARATSVENEFTTLAASAVGGLNMRCLGVEGSTTIGGINSLDHRATFLDAYPASVGKTRGNSVLVVGEGVNAPNQFSDFATYIEARVAAGWGQIIILAPSVTSGWTGGDNSVTTFYNQVKAQAWPSRVQVCDLRQGTLASFDQSYFADSVHWNNTGHDAAAALLAPSLAAAKEEVSGNGSPIDSTAPTLISATIPSAGNKFVLVFSEAVQGLNSSQFSSPGVTLSNPQGGGTNWSFDASTIYQGAAKMLSYSGTATTDLAGNALAPFSNFVVANGSTISAPVPPGKVPVRVTYGFNGTPVPNATFTFRLVGLSDAFFIGVALQDLSQTLTTTVGDDIVELLQPSGDGFWVCECPNGENFALDLSDVEFSGEPVELKDVRA